METANITSCAGCGRPLVDGQCQACDRTTESTFIHREIVVLVVLCALVAVGFVLTRAAAGANRAHRLRDAAAWYGAGEHHLVGGQTESAIKALRRRDRDQSRQPEPIDLPWQAPSRQTDRTMRPGRCCSGSANRLPRILR